ncbi:hypothetical protein BD324DRAFT_649780 [Kockovaella imperatae]|uniref:Uncharacterized protein n=1 Tax=Kockovaella imperatae TaxID=4999 RepID=A0A1Y1UK31_9TREE|nr:hypothetical protein BD324DRAFT_649780 [Kockovaella imperatae]ORX38411.1 hypothetical protein BD324DRAFT_649780 [Kockovaella imperatae]
MPRFPASQLKTPVVPSLRAASTLARPTSQTAIQLASKSPIRAIVILPIQLNGTASPTHVQLAQRRWASSSSEKEAAAKQLANTSRPTDESGSTASNEGIVQGATRELKSVASGVAEIISGGGHHSSRQEKTDSGAGPHGAQEISSHSHSGSVRDDFIGITKNIFQWVPQPALVVGLAGTLPYLGTAFGTIFLAREAARESQGLSTITGGSLDSILGNLHTLEHIQITYGAIILSFLGAIHWGMEFSKYGGYQGYNRLALGVAPVLIAWPTTFLPHGLALVAQWLGFTGTWFLDQRASSNGWTPPWYATYRFYLSLIVGFSIIATFAGTGYYGAGAGATVTSKDKRTLHTTERVSPLKKMSRIEEAKHPKHGETLTGRATGTVKGPIALEEEEDGDHFLKLRNFKKEKEEEEEREREEEEERQKKEEEKKTKKEENQKFQDERDQHQQEKAPGSMKSEAKNRTGENELADGKDKTEANKK